MKSIENTVFTREYAVAILFDLAGNLLFQLRDDIPTIVHPGKISLFGGHRENRESFLDCVVREIHEELAFYVPPEHFKFLSERIEPDPDVPEGKMRAEIFVAGDIPAVSLRVTEGSLKVVSIDDLEVIAEKFTPTTLFALETFLDKKLLR